MKSNFVKKAFCLSAALISVVTASNYTSLYSKTNVTDTPVKIANKNLESIIRGIIAKPKGEISKTDLHKVWDYSTSHFSYAMFKWDEFFHNSPNTIDMLFLGSSHSYRSFDPEFFDKKLNTNSFNLGTSGEYPIQDYYELKEALKYQKPKLLVYELYWKEFEFKEKTDESEYDYEHYKTSPNSVDKYTSLKAMFEHKECFNDWLKLMKDNKFLVDEYYKDKGFVFNSDVAPYQKLTEWNIFDPQDKFIVNKDELDYFNKVLDLCRKNSIKVLLVTSPIPQESLKKVKNYSYVHNYFVKIAKNNNLNYLDYNCYNDTGVVPKDSYFKDGDHLNSYGASIISNNLVNYIKLNYNLTK